MIILGILAVVLLDFEVSSSQNQSPWSRTPENLQVLPKEFTGERLRPVMVGFSRALGVRCSHCHVGEEGQPLSTFDFVSDENPNKDRAREMLRMLGSINEHLDKIEPSGPEPVNMWCHTCHRGTPRPMRLNEQLVETWKAGGSDAAIERYRELHERYYGRGAYDFGEGSLNAVGYTLLNAEDFDGAIAIFTANTEEFPESANVWDSLGEAYMKSGRDDEAVQAYERSLALDPENENATKMLDQLRGN